jgi:hypothetical protein
VVAWRVPDTCSNQQRREPERGASRISGERTDLGAEMEDASERHEGEGRPGTAGLPIAPHNIGWPPAPNDLQSWRSVPPLSQPAICRLADGVPTDMVRDRRRAVRGHGNAVVPAVAEVIGHVLIAMARSEVLQLRAEVADG